ncbi:MAG: hypothetical protein ABJZ55_01420 [Fuerstiella sp.]
MFFRFVCALILAALVSMTGIVLEKQTLERKRDVTRQYYQLDLMLEFHAQSRLRIQKLTSPSLQIAAEGLTPSSVADSEWAMESYLVTEAKTEGVNVVAGTSQQGNSADVKASESRPSGSRRSGSRRSGSQRSGSNLPLLRWQQPVSADQANPNGR